MNTSCWTTMLLWLLVDELHRVLDGDDLGPAAAVDQVDHVVERGRLAVAGGAGDQDQAVGQPRQLVDDGGQAQLRRGRGPSSRRGGSPSRAPPRAGRRWRRTGRRPPSAARSRAASRARRSRDASRSSARRSSRGAIDSSSGSPSISRISPLMRIRRRDAADQVNVAGAELPRALQDLVERPGHRDCDSSVAEVWTQSLKAVADQAPQTPARATSPGCELGQLAAGLDVSRRELQATL